MDVTFAAKELSRRMARPRRWDWRDRKRFVKEIYIYIIKFDYQNECKHVDVWMDTDYTGCHETCKSMSGGIIQLGKHIIRNWCSTQRIIAL